MKRQYIKQSGFALPTILIASVVMLLVLMSALQTIVTARLGITERYYQQLASEAAEAGLKVAEGCIKADATYSAPWSAGNPLNTGDDCTGTPISGVATTVVSQDSPAKLATSYSVAFPDNTQNPVIVEAVGTVELKRTSNNATWKTYTATKKMSLSRGVKRATQFSSGSGFSCAIFDYETWCFGQNRHGALGVGLCPSNAGWMHAVQVPSCPGTSLDSTLVPRKVVRLEGALAGKKDRLVVAGNYAACVVTSDIDDNDLVYCWGTNQAGLLGRGTTANYSALQPELVDMTLLAGKSITDIEMGNFRTCVVADGDVYCWGHGDRGALGRGGATPNAHSGSPIKVQGIGASEATSRPVIDIGTTPDLQSTCAVISLTSPNQAGRVYCWGRNQRGQIGNNTTTDQATPVLVSGVTNAIAVTGGGAVTTVSSSDTDINASGTTLGIDSSTATDVDRITRAHFCAVTVAKKLYCWGANQYGQLGIGLSITDGRSVAPNASRSLTATIANQTLYGTSVTMNNATVEQVATSYGSTCALVSAPSAVANKVWCIGQNNFSIARNGVRGYTSRWVDDRDAAFIMKNNFYPMTLPSSATVQAVIGSSNRMCAIADDRLHCVGNNQVGQLGVGDTESSNDPREAKVLRQFDTFQMY